jgi:two-component system nitrate/nitrite response regulator NarL
MTVLGSPSRPVGRSRVGEFPTVALVDDHLLLVETVQTALRARGLDVTSYPPELGEDLLPELLAAAPDLVLLDLDLGAFGDSTRLIGPLTGAGIRVLIVTGVPDRLRIARALELGAIGYRSKAGGFQTLLNAAQQAAAGTSGFDMAVRETLLDELRRARADRARRVAPFDRLTARERAALRALCEGLSVREIADIWMVSEATVRSHVQGILGKLGAASQVQAVAETLRRGWFEDLRDRWAG